MYSLTLTHDDRKTIDWIGNRYSHGDYLHRCLWADSTQTPDDADWDDPRDIAFSIPEHVAWEVKDLIEADGLACLGPELTSKLWAFCDQIV